MIWRKSLKMLLLWGTGMVLCTGALLGQEQPQTRPAINDTEVKRALGDYDEVEHRARSEYDRTISAAKAELIKKLQLRLDALTKLGRLDNALALRDLINSLKPKPAAPVAARQPPVTLFLSSAEAVGAWAEGNGTKILLNADGTFIYASGVQRGTWKVTDKALVLIWSNGRIDQYNAHDGDRISGESTTGKRVTVQRVVADR